MEYPISEIIDRCSIAQLKSERIPDELDKTELDILKKEIFSFCEQFPEHREFIDEAEKQLYNANEKIWNLESDIRKGKEQIIGLEEVGRRAIQIRGLNKIRVGIKNEIVNHTGNGFIDVKMNHASE